MKIFLTGAIDSGKSYLINQLIQEYHFPVCGFQTLPLYHEGKRQGFYLHSLVSMQENDVLFAHQQENNCKVIPNVFNTFGFTLLKESMKYKDHVLILDEIGRLEKEEFQYLDILLKAIEKHSFILGVLKKCDVQYIQEIATRKDVIVYDLDEHSYEEVYHLIKRRIEYEKNK